MAEEKIWICPSCGKIYVFSVEEDDYPCFCICGAVLIEENSGLPSRSKSCKQGERDD